MKGAGPHGSAPFFWWHGAIATKFMIIGYAEGSWALYEHSC